MNPCAIQQNMVAGGSVSERRDRDYLVCPKPRRLGLLNAAINNNDPQPLRATRWNLSHQVENFDSKAGSDVFDIIVPKGGGYGGTEQSCTQVASSPPFFCGSPPSRVANPLIHDSRFGDEKTTPPLSPLLPVMLPSSPSSSSSRKGGVGIGGGSGGGCVRPNFGNKPAVRIEGFDCLDRDRRNCSSIPALA